MNNCPNLSPETAAAYQAILSAPKVKEALEYLKLNEDDTLREQKELCAVQSPPFGEKVRAQEYEKRLIACGAENVKIDSEGNVFGSIKGSGCGPTVMIAAHLDTVFPAGTDTVVREENGLLYAPGITDDTRGLAEVLSVLRALKKSGLSLCGDILFCGNVGEEGLGDLRGVRHIFSGEHGIDAFISVDGFTQVGVITYLGIGVRRYQVTYRGPGGHSMWAFGNPSAVHAMGRAIADIADIDVPAEPLTTFTVGMANGGTSVNVIADQADILVDMRSVSAEELTILEEKVLAACRQAAAIENKRWNSDKIMVEIERKSSRPAGAQAADSIIVQTACAATRAIGTAPELAPPSSTDSNLPISLGIPAITLDCGGIGYGAHTLQEHYDPTDGFLGPQRELLLLLGLVGVQGVCDPLLQKDKKERVVKNLEKK